MNSISVCLDRAARHPYRLILSWLIPILVLEHYKPSQTGVPATVLSLVKALLYEYGYWPE